MATKKDNLKSLFSNTRSRIIILFTAVLLLLAVIVGVSKLLSAPSAEKQASASISSVPSVGSTPGQLNPAPEYVKLLQAQNITQAKQAELRGTSAIPTIIQLQKLGEGGKGLQNVGQGVGFQALAREDQLGPQQSLWLQELQQSNCSKAVVDKATSEGARLPDLRKGCSCAQLKENGLKLSDLHQVCSCKELRAAGYNARQLKEQGFSVDRLRRCGFNACELRDAGFTAQQLKEGGFTDGELRGAGYSSNEIQKARGLPEGIKEEDLHKAGCSPDALRKLREAGVSAREIRLTSGCSASAMKKAGYTAQELRDAGYTAAQLKAAGFTALQLSDTGVTTEQLKAVGFTPAEIGIAPPPPVAPQPQPSQLPPGLTPRENVQTSADRSTQQLQQLLKQQQKQFDQQQFQQQIDQRRAQMQGDANESLSSWKQVATQVYVEGKKPKQEPGVSVSKVSEEDSSNVTVVNGSKQNSSQYPSVKMGDIMFAVMDTSVNSDEAGPILATIVSGPYKGSKLIGSFTTTEQSGKMTIQFNNISVPGISTTQTISAFAIDPNTARTALSSRTDYHYLYRYGSLFASTFLEGFGNAFQSADTTVTIGGTGGGDNITVQNGINRSALENAVIGLATLGKTWSQFAQQNFNRKPTIEVFSGTAIGVLFTQDVTFSSSNS